MSMTNDAAVLEELDFQPRCDGERDGDCVADAKYSVRCKGVGCGQGLILCAEHTRTAWKRAFWGCWCTACGRAGRRMTDVWDLERIAR